MSFSLSITFKGVKGAQDALTEFDSTVYRSSIRFSRFYGTNCYWKKCNH